MLRGELKANGILLTYDYIKYEDLVSCARYCARQQCVEDRPIHYCQGCTLDDRVTRHPSSGFEDVSRRDTWLDAAQWLAERTE